MRGALRSPINETCPKSIKLFRLRISSQILIYSLSFAWWMVCALNFIDKRLDCVKFVKVRPHTLSNTVLLSGVFVQESVYFRKGDSFFWLGSLEAFSVRKPTHDRKLHILKDYNCFFSFKLRLNALNLRNFSKLRIFGWTFEDRFWRWWPRLATFNIFWPKNVLFLFWHGCWHWSYATISIFGPK